MLRGAIKLAVVILILSGASNALAAGSGMPWEDIVTKIMDSITGPVAKALGVIAIASTGLALAFGEGGHGFRKLLQIVFGLSIAFTATSFLLGFLGFGGGAGF
jgi:type IV secretion system protein VirB2